MSSKKGNDENMNEIEKSARLEQEKADADFAVNLQLEDVSNGLASMDFETASDIAAEKKRNCPKGHPLEMFEVSFGRQIECDACCRQLHWGERVHSCVVCDFDLCDICQIEATSAVGEEHAKVEPPSSSLSTKTTPNLPTTPKITPQHLLWKDTQFSAAVCRVPFLLPVVTGGEHASVEAIVDSTAPFSIISSPLVQHLGLTIIPGPYTVSHGNIIGEIPDISVVIVGRNPQQQMQLPMNFLVMDTSTIPHQPDSIFLVLGVDQMKRHACVIDMENNSLIVGGRQRGLEVFFISPSPY